MSFFPWNDGYSVNIREIDEQHKRLVSLVDEMYEAMRAGKGSEVLGKILADLIHYTKTHFATEERYFRLYGYPEFEVHKKEHDILTGQAMDLKEKFDAGQTALSSQTGTFLKNWLINHIQKTDKKYSAFLNGKGLH